MPIPFRDADDLTELGLAGYLTIEPAPAGAGYLGALFQINARGEPVEFTYNRIETGNPFLWRPDDLRRHAHRRLTASLFATSPSASGGPRLILCRADEVDPALFTTDLTTPIPVGRLARTLETIDRATGEIIETTTGEDASHLFWYPEPPAEGSPARRLLDALIARGLLWEPFERARIGLREVYQAEFEGVW